MPQGRDRQYQRRHEPPRKPDRAEKRGSRHVPNPLRPQNRKAPGRRDLGTAARPIPRLIRRLVSGELPPATYLYEEDPEDAAAGDRTGQAGTAGYAGKETGQ